MSQKTHWKYYFAYFFGAVFLTNAIPHWINGLSGNAFQSPFASPPGEGLSSALVNVLWGAFNLAVGYLLICRVGNFDPRDNKKAAAFAAGLLATSVMTALAFGRFHGGR